MLTQQIQIADVAGLHARPATEFVKRAQSVQSQVTLVCRGREANGKSILSILALGAISGENLTLRVEGPDEVAALRMLGTQLNSLLNAVEEA